MIIRKQTDPDEDPNTTAVRLHEDVRHRSRHAEHVHAHRRRRRRRSSNVLFGDDYTVTEDVIPAGWDFDNLDCAASVGVTPSITGTTVTFDIDNAADVLDCTYTNRATGHDHRREDHRRRDRVLRLHVGHPDTVAVHPDHDRGWCRRQGLGDVLRPRPGHVRRRRDGAGRLEPRLRDLRRRQRPCRHRLGGGETVTCTFHDARETGAIEITKTRKHAAAGSGDHPHAGVTFTVTGGGLPARRRDGRDRRQWRGLRGWARAQQLRGSGTTPSPRRSRPGTRPRRRPRTPSR